MNAASMHGRLSAFRIIGAAFQSGQVWGLERLMGGDYFNFVVDKLGVRPLAEDEFYDGIQDVR